MAEINTVVSVPELEKLIGRLVANIKVPDEKLVQRFDNKLALLRRGMGFVVVLPTCHQDVPKPEEVPVRTVTEGAADVAKRATEVAKEAREVADEAEDVAEKARQAADDAIAAEKSAADAQVKGAGLEASSTAPDNSQRAG